MTPRIHNLLLREAGGEVGGDEIRSDGVSRAAVALVCRHDVDFDVKVMLERGIVDGWRWQRRYSGPNRS